MIKRLVFAVALLAVGVSVQPDRHLDEWYASYNHAYFQDELPKDVLITRTLNDPRFMALTLYSDGHYHIDINPKYNLSTKTERINLLHESCHIRQFIEDDEEFDQHGPHFQNCMLGLAKQGAFSDLW